MSHWKIGVKILCSKSWEGQNSMKAKIWGSKFYFFLVEPIVKILCSLKRGVKILYFFPVPWKRGVKTAEPTNQLHWRGAPPGITSMWVLLIRVHHTDLWCQFAPIPSHVSSKHLTLHSATHPHTHTHTQPTHPRHFGRRHFQIAFSWMKMIEFRFKFHLIMLPGVQLTISQHWFR